MVPVDQEKNHLVQPKIYTGTQHGIEKAVIDPDAIYVIKKLQDAGFIAYLVGGGVRDLLIKRTPKDFDISTSALPEQIKQLFGRNCILIGRRFRLAHLRFGHKIMEVSTFRTGDNESDLILQDNQWGTPEQDVLRRDFTINGLFYDPFQDTVIDFVGGWEDIHQKMLRTIGNPIPRFKQDPVRMIRLIKFRARFGFEIDPNTLQALNRCREEITKSAPARILEEMLRMLESTASAPFFQIMTEWGMLEHLFPCLTHFLEGKFGGEVYKYLASADELNQNAGRHTLDRSVLTSCLLFPILKEEIRSQFLDQDVVPHFGDVMLLTSAIIKGVVTSSFSHFPRRLSSSMGYILSTQYRFTPLSGKKHHRPKLFHHKEFSLALDFYRIRAMLDNSLMDDYLAWRNLYKQFTRQGERRGRQHHSPPNQKAET